MPAVAKPISTAPRDGTHIVGHDKYGWREMWWKEDLYEGAFWMDHADSEPEPTHWIELPLVSTSEHVEMLSLGDAITRARGDHN